MSWDLSTHSIERRRPSGPPLNQDPAPGQALDTVVEDDFYFDGQRLTPICLIAAGGGCSASVRYADAAMPDFTQSGGWHYFRAATEGAFGRFFWSPDHMSWVVEYKDGTTLELGSAPSSPNIATSLDFDTQQQTTGSNKPYRWNLVHQHDQHRDVSGYANDAVYIWSKLETDSSGNATLANPSYLTDIYYSGGTGSAPSAVTQLATAEFHVRLGYEPSPEARDPVGPPIWRATPRWRLKTVDVAAMPYLPAAEGGTAREVMRRYALSYVTYNHASFLQQVQLFGCAGTSPAHEDPSGQSLTAASAATC
jgi:hypothetical protein